MNSKRELPRTDSISELATFWDTHDLTDFEDDLEDVEEKVFSRAITKHEFTLILSAEPNEAQADRLYSVIVDGTISTIAGVPQIHFHREAASLVEAIRSAIDDTRKAALEVIRVEIAPDDVLQAS